MKKATSFLGPVSFLVLAGTGVFWAFRRGGQDFSVFYQVWKLILSGQGSQIYQNSPDRFLYAPGFGYLLSPLALFPFNIALALWCGLKILALVFLLRLFTSTITSPSLYFGALLFIARPLLLDFRYGQINIFLLFSSLWALFIFTQDPHKKKSLFLSWFLLGFFSASKLLTLPLLLIPWITRDPKLKQAQWGALSGVLVTFSTPFLFNPSVALTLFSQWKVALMNRGVPLESDNQSFVALLHRLLSGKPVHLVSHGSQFLSLGSPLASEGTIFLLGLIWAALIFSLYFYWMFRGPKGQPLRWIALLLGLLILPSHLIWKSYFVFALPLALVALKDFSHSKKIPAACFLGLVFFLMNLSNYDFIGLHYAWKLEAYSVMLLAHLLLLVIVFLGNQQRHQLPRS